MRPCHCEQREAISFFHLRNYYNEIAALPFGRLAMTIVMFSKLCKTSCNIRALLHWLYQ